MARVGPYDTSPLSDKPGPRRIPDFGRAVAHALIRAGHPESEAIAIARSRIAAWASGGGNVTVKTRAKAAATIAEWDALDKARKAVKTSAPTTGGHPMDPEATTMCPTCGGPARARLQSTHPDAVRMSAGAVSGSAVSFAMQSGETKAMGKLPPALKAKAIAMAQQRMKGKK